MGIQEGPMCNLIGTRNMLIHKLGDGFIGIYFFIMHHNLHSIYILLYL